MPSLLGVALEERGYDALFVPEHTHIPVSRRTPRPAAYGGGELPGYYARTHDPFVFLTGVASHTTRLRVGTGVCLLAQRDAIVTAKQAASLDQLSGGRFIFGVGYGWIREELENHGGRFEDRHVVVAERVAAIKALWTEEEAEFSGKTLQFELSWMRPKPAQVPHPPILIGGSGERAMADVLAWGDGWMPVVDLPDERLAKRVDRLRELALDADRDPASIDIRLTCSPETNLSAMAELGIENVALSMPCDVPADELMNLLDKHAPG